MDCAQRTHVVVSTRVAMLMGQEMHENSSHEEHSACVSEREKERGRGIAFYHPELQSCGFKSFEFVSDKLHLRSVWRTK